MLRKVAEEVLDVLSLFSSDKEKSWSVRLVDGYIFDNEVRTEQCDTCESKSKLVTGNFGSKDVVLYGCNGHKCKHLLIRVSFSPEVQNVERAHEYEIVMPPKANAH